MSERDKAVEAMARAICADNAEHIRVDLEWHEWTMEAQSALTALLTLHPSLASVLDGTGVVVPVEQIREWNSKLSAALGEKPGA